MEKLRAKTTYQSTNDGFGVLGDLFETIINRLLGSVTGEVGSQAGSGAKNRRNKKSQILPVLKEN
jgi:hypothetical protein